MAEVVGDHGPSLLSLGPSGIGPEQQLDTANGMRKLIIPIYERSLVPAIRAFEVFETQRVCFVFLESGTSSLFHVATLHFSNPPADTLSTAEFLPMSATTLLDPSINANRPFLNDDTHNSQNRRHSRNKGRGRRDGDSGGNETHRVSAAGASIDVHSSSSGAFADNGSSVRQAEDNGSRRSRRGGRGRGGGDVGSRAVSQAEYQNAAAGANRQVAGRGQRRGAPNQQRGGGGHSRQASAQSAPTRRPLEIVINGIQVSGDHADHSHAASASVAQSVKVTQRSPVKQYFSAPAQEYEDLTTALVEGLTNGSYECMVCYDAVKPREKTWDCDVCYAVFHLKRNGPKNPWKPPQPPTPQPAGAVPAAKTKTPPSPRATHVSAPNPKTHLTTPISAPTPAANPVSAPAPALTNAQTSATPVPASLAKVLHHRLNVSAERAHS
ncbi:hypothetical protein HK097_001316 [Rhizophlyctis rosea]|uniref:Uncharacterized protein n=1 Tax=Rhizophlyctis rosea TaxID=64517 RepID=A0AAD5S6W1_9FUNG|nr:hypothetical protein HK097_001316 [Rhizophlyctis rosea]